MTEIALRGIFLPLVTPFLVDEVDEASLKKLVTHYNGLPIAGYVVGGTTGEAHSLSRQELFLLANYVRSQTSKSVLLGISGVSTQDAVDQVRFLGAAPVDGFLLSLPAYVRPTQEGLKQYVKSVTSEDPRPFVLYNIPYRSAVNLENASVFELAQIDNVVGIKDCCGSAQQTADLLMERPSNFAVLTGDDGVFFSALAHGADGGILASALADPLGFHELQLHIQNGKLSEARAVWKRLTPLIRTLFAEPNPGPLKYWLHAKGFIREATVRPPLLNVTAHTRDQLDTLLSGDKGSGHGK